MSGSVCNTSCRFDSRDIYESAGEIHSQVFVSKHWSSIIRDKKFTELYITRSSSRPRFLFRYKTMNSQFLESCSQKEASSNHQRVKIPSHPLDFMYMNGLSAPVRGLICLGNCNTIRILNLSTGQFLALPRVEDRSLLCFFGYDIVNDVYKVLCMTMLDGNRNRGSTFVSYEHQVFTLGPKQKWRKIVCKHPHTPLYLLSTKTKGICINGVVYYYSWIKKEGSLICFDLTSEEFSVVKLPVDIKDLVNYGGKITLCSKMMYDGRLDLWVLQDAKKQEWSKVSHSVPSWIHLVRGLEFHFEGTLSTGELIFVPDFFVPVKPYFLISYDLKRNNAKKVVIKGIGNYSPYIDCHFDHVESPMILSNAS